MVTNEPKYLHLRVFLLFMIVGVLLALILYKMRIVELSEVWKPIIAPYLAYVATYVIILLSYLEYDCWVSRKSQTSKKKGSKRDE